MLSLDFGSAKYPDSQGDLKYPDKFYNPHIKVIFIFYTLLKLNYNEILGSERILGVSNIALA